MGSEESQRLVAKSGQGMRLRGQMQAQLFTKCDNVCIRDVLDGAKVFVAGAFSKGDCMYTNNDGDSVDFVNPDTGEPYLTEEECDEADGDWVENINGGAIDILKNAYRAMKDPRDGGMIKMFFTVFAQGFYYVKDRMVTGLGMHTQIRDAWMKLRQGASSGLGAYPLRTEKRSLYDKARIKIQELLRDPIDAICGVLPGVSVSILFVGTDISLAELCASGLKSIVNHYLGWMKKQIKKMIKKIFEEKGKPDLGRRIIRLLTAPLGFVFRKFEEEMDKKSGDVFKKLFDVVRNILNDLEISRYQHQFKKIEEVSQSYCFDEENKQMFQGPDKNKKADEKFAEDVKQITSKLKPILDGLSSSIDEHTELLDGYNSIDVGAEEGQEGKIEDKIERVVYVCSLVFDPRVANVWTSDMIDALITSVMTQFTVAMTPKKRVMAQRELRPRQQPS